MKRFFRFLRCAALLLGCTSGLACSTSREIGENIDADSGADSDADGDADADSDTDSDTDTDFDCAESAKYIYVYDAKNNLYRFDPTALSAEAFEFVAAVVPPSGKFPYSLSVTRDGRGLILFDNDNSGANPGVCYGVFDVDLQTGATDPVPLPYDCGLLDPDLPGFPFAMAFATDEAGATTDELFVASHRWNGPKLYNLDRVTGALSYRADFPVSGYPDITGNADGELWWLADASYAALDGDCAAIDLEGYGSAIEMCDGVVFGRIDTNLYEFEEAFVIPELYVDQTSVEAVFEAFAHWGGAYYVFWGAGDAYVNSKVYKITVPDGGGPATTELFIENTGLQIVGAGVSTCAPIVVE